MKTDIFDQTSSYIFAGIFAISLIASISWKIILNSTYENKRKPKFITPLNVFTVGTFIAVYFLFIDFGDFRSAIDSLKNTLDAFKLFLTFDEIYEWATKIKPPFEVENIKTFDRILVFCLYFGLPLLTMRAFFSLFKDKFVQLRYYFSFGRECHVFSALTEKSACLATDIYNKSDSRIKPLIIFCNVNTGNASDGLLLKTEGINAGYYKKSVLDFKTNKLFEFKKTKNNSFYLLDEDYAINERDCMHLTKSDNEAIDHLYVFSSLESSTCIVNTAKKTKKYKYPVHLINEAQMIAYSLLFEHPMYESASRGMNSVLVVGAGQNGLEIAKNTLWCGKMVTLDFKLRIIDKDDKMKELKAKYGDFEKNAAEAGVCVNCECMQINVDRDGLEDAVNCCSDATYIVVALGNDELTLSTAVFLRKLYRRRPDGCSPKIIPILKSSNYKKIADSAKEFDLTPFGFYENIYSCETINNWKIEVIARELNKKYEEHNNNGKKRENSDNYDDLHEIERLSNCAVAVHSKYKVYDEGYFIEKGENGKYKYIKRENAYSPSVEKHRKNEHDRWVLFMILNGWKTMSPKKALSRQKKGEKSPQKDYGNETHACITENDNLSDLAETLGYESDNYIRYDHLMVENTKKFLIDVLNSPKNQRRESDDIRAKSD